MSTGGGLCMMSNFQKENHELLGPMFLPRGSLSTGTTHCSCERKVETVWDGSP